MSTIISLTFDLVDLFTFSLQEFYCTGQEFLALWVGYRSGVRDNASYQYYVHIYCVFRLWVMDSIYNVYILPVFLYGAKTWYITKAIEKRIDAFDQWCLRRILNITWSECVTNFEVRRRTGQPLLSDRVN